MPFRFNPFTGNLDLVDTTTAAGSNTQIQFNDSGSLAGDVDLTWNKTTNVMTVAGDVNLSDGGSFTTTLQTITPTANRTVSIPDATGTLALVAGSSGQLVYNNAGAYAGLSTATIGATGNITLSLNGAASTPPVSFTGTWFTGGTSTTTKPQLLIEPTGTTSTAWSTSGTGLGVNAASGFAGNLLDLQVNGTSQFSVGSGSVTTRATSFSLSQTSGNFSLTFPDVAGATGQSITIGAQNNTSGNFSGGDLTLRAGSGQGSGNPGRIVLRPNNTLTSVLFAGVGTTFQELRQTASSILSWVSGTDVLATAADVGLTRSATNTLKVTNGSTGDGTISGQLRAVGTAPASSGATGTAGDIRYDADYIYVCTATNTWKRAALATW